MATIPFNLLFCLLLGLCFTACARTQLESGAEPWRRELGLVLSFAVLTVAPIASYLYLMYPDWSWMYLVPPARLPRGIGLAVVVVTTLMAPVGFLLGWIALRLLPGRKDRGLAAVVGVVLCGLITLVALARHRLSVVGRFEDYQSHTLVRPLLGTKLGFAWLLSAPFLLAAAALVGWYLWGYGRWLRQQAHAGSHVASHPMRVIASGASAVLPSTPSGR